MKPTDAKNTCYWHPVFARFARITLDTMRNIARRNSTPLTCRTVNTSLTLENIDGERLVLYHLSSMTKIRQKRTMNLMIQQALIPLGKESITPFCPQELLKAYA